MHTNPLLDTEKVTEHVYRGFIKEPAIIDHTIQIFNTKKQEIYQVFENFELLEETRKKQAIRYLDQFYEIINNDRLVEREFLNRARVVHDY